MSGPVIILGAGGHAGVLVDALALSGIEMFGLVDRDSALHGTEVQGVPVLGDEDVLDDHDPGKVRLVNALGSVKSMELRKRVFERFLSRGYGFAQVIHPSAVISPSAELGDGVQVMAGAVVMPGARIGANTLVNTRSSVDHDCVIGEHVHIAPGVVISGAVSVGSGTHIGTGAAVIQGVEIGAGCLVAAGAVVITNVRDGEFVRGVPARGNGK